MRVLVLVDLVQDIDVLLPVLLALRDQQGLDVRVYVSRWLHEASPRTEALLREHALAFRWVRRRDVSQGAQPTLNGVRAVLTASESTHPAHAAAHALARRANGCRIATYTLQHGLENVGLLGEPGHEFASAHVLTWHPPELTTAAPEQTRAKLRHVGRPMLAPSAGAPPAYHVGVFENLHSPVYNESDRERFAAGLAALARSGLRILLKPHPAGRWSADSGHAPSPPVDIALGMSATEAISRVERVITTPSTIVLDAALLDRPVALAAAGSPLVSSFPLLSDPQEWLSFASAPDRQREIRERFLRLTLVPGEASGAIAQLISRASVAEKL